MRLFVQRKGELIWPVTRSDAAQVARLPERRVLEIEVMSAPAPRLARWFFAACQILCEATGKAPNAELMRRQILIRAGYFESVVLSGDGTTRINPMSTAGWGEIEWKGAIEQLMPVLLELAGEAMPAFRARVDSFFGVGLRELMKD